MILTLLLAIMMMVGLFLLLWAGVGFIQNKKFFSSCPKEVFELIQPKEKRFFGQYILGWLLAFVAVLLMLGAIIIGALNGIQNDFTIIQFSARFMTMLLLLKVFDIIFFDWILLCHRGFGFFEKYYPEVKEALSPKLFGYNKKEHLIHIIFIIIGSLILAWICKLF
ncbi:hypothetical protein [Anaerococcus sp.]|uniref:hypothetical protein n=1 Tax=Anaerococcus sp. TaxID=1872515 RepID=UPI002A91A16C|nr:hypothetical protein [Anaerococcus sp.]MDY6127529.1 hypothetical protein [Anaerococcus sp.]